MSLTGVAHRLTHSEREREPKSLAVIAWFDGWARGAGEGPHRTYPRRLSLSEAAAWREGHREGATERRCHRAHGFTPCTGDHS